MSLRARSLRPDLLLLAAVACWTRPCPAHVPVPEGDIGIGPSFAYGARAESRDSWILGIDAAYGWMPLWGGGGVRMLHGSSTWIAPYAEAGLFFFGNIGAGCTYLPQSPGRKFHPHLFLGVPVPVGAEVFSYPVYVEPYYRPLWLEGPTLHEVGLFVKLTTWGR